MKEENTLPKIDITEDFMIVTEVDIGTLNLYTNYPCRIKALVAVFCLEGGLEAELNMVNYNIKANDFATVLPDNIIQIKKIEGNLRLYILLYSSKFIESTNILDANSNVVQIIKERPVISLPLNIANVFNDYFALVKKVCRGNLLPQTIEFYKNILYTIAYALTDTYGRMQWTKVALPRSKEILRLFEQLVIKFYSKERNVSFYAGKLGITVQHLCNTVKHETGETVIDIINKHVILDAKAQIKTTSDTIQ
ncbi:MAG: AraC family transcriptional regulator, partial [Bacteroidales bacterium]